MRDALKQRLFDLGYGTGSKTPLEAITYIEELELELYEMNVLYGAVKDGLEEKLATAMEALRDLATCVDDGCYCSEAKMAGAMDNARATLAELEGKE